MQKQPTSLSLRIFTWRRDRAPGRLSGAFTEASAPGPRIWLPQAQVEGQAFPRKHQTQPSWPVERKPGLCAFHLEETESGNSESGPHCIRPIRAVSVEPFSEPCRPATWPCSEGEVSSGDSLPRGPGRLGEAGSPGRAPVLGVQLCWPHAADIPGLLA